MRELREIKNINIIFFFYIFLFIADRTYRQEINIKGCQVGTFG